MPPRKQRPPPPPPPTYPARPINGGNLEVALQVDPLDPALWMYRPKWNGRRVLLHVPTMRTWNRQLEENAWVFPALKKLMDIVNYGDIWPPTLEWLDIELLYGKTSIAKRALIVLDFVSENMIWQDRNAVLKMAFEGHLLESIYQQPQHDEVYFFHPSISGNPESDLLKEWQEMQELNKEWGATFYEGLVAYDMRAKYPVQLFSPNKETRHWIKYRFIT
jgi:hypothetical protein